MLIAGVPYQDAARTWEGDLETFRDRREPFLLY